MITTFRPMLVSSGPLPPDSGRYAYEVKWDGFRALAHVDPPQVTVMSRNGNDMTLRFPELGGLADAAGGALVLDGEIVVLGDDGTPDFAALWARTHAGGGSSAGRLCFMAFDLVLRGSETLIDRPYRERRAMLEDLALEGSAWFTPPAYVGEGASLFAATKRMGLEGVVAKRLDSRYRPGLRSKSWVKTKHMQRRSFALLGWVPPEEWRGDRGCVVLGLETGAGIAIAGVVESGYGRDLVDRLPELTRAELRSLQEPGRTWEEPTAFVGEVTFLEWSTAGGLRHATLRSVQAPTVAR